MNDVAVVLLPLAVGGTLLVAGQCFLRPVLASAKTMVAMENQAHRYGWVLHSGATFLFLGVFVSIGSAATAHSEILVGALMGVASAMFVSLLFAPPRRERTVGIIDKWRFAATCLFHGLAGAALGAATVQPLA